MSTPQFPDSEARLRQTLEEIQQEGRVRHERMLLLGYREDAGLGGVVANAQNKQETLWNALSPRADHTFHIWRLDQPSSTAEIFRTVAETETYLAHVATLPRYRLQLDGNPRLVIEGGKQTRITDKLSGEHFVITEEDLQILRSRLGSAEIAVHADSAPTIGDWVKE